VEHSLGPRNDARTTSEDTEKHRSQLARRQPVVRRAELSPLGGNDLFGGVRDVFGEHDCQTNVQVEVDVAVEEPRSSIIGHESEGYVVARETGVNDVADNGVVVVVHGAAGAADDMEVVAVQVERVGSARVGASGDADFDDFVGGKGVVGARRKEVLGELGTR